MSNFYQGNAAVANTNSNTKASDDSWKAEGFLNFDVPSSEEGEWIKFGALKLMGNDTNHVMLIDYLTSSEDPIEREAAMLKFLSKIRVTYRSAKSTAKKASFKLV